MVYRQLRRDDCRNRHVHHSQPRIDHHLLCPLGENLRQLDVRNHVGDGQPDSRRADIGVRKPLTDLRRRQHHPDGKTRIGGHLRLVYGQLWRNSGRNGHVYHRQPGGDYHILRAMGNHELWELDLREHIGYCRCASHAADVRVRKPGLDLFWRKHHVDSDRRIG